MFFFRKVICFSRDTNGMMLSELFCLHIVVGADLSNRFPDVFCLETRHPKRFVYSCCCDSLQLSIFSWILLGGPPKEESTESNDVLGID